MGTPTKLYWEDTEGGMSGAHDVLMANDAKYVGHFYVDADDSVDVEAVLLLIAAAPDLLGALKYVRRFLNPEDHDVAYVDCVIDTATGHPAAIAKAEGRTNA